MQSCTSAARAGPRRRLPAIAVLVLLLVGASCTSTGSAPGGSAVPGTSGPARRPNILFVLTDDMRIDDLQFMPKVRSLIGDQGMSFDAYFDNVTLCCPARTSILRGQYSHNTGVLTNGGTNGGFETAYKSGIEKSTVATALHEAGYRTGLFGKYLNGYPHSAGEGYVPPGWDRWVSPSKGDAYSEYNYTLNEDGTQVAYGHEPRDYGTDVYMGKTRDFVTQAAADGKPFFAYLAVYAPHQPATPAPGDEGLFADATAPRDASFDEGDVNDKPRWVQEHQVLNDNHKRTLDELYRKRIRSLQAVDRGVAGLVTTLEQSGQLSNTYIVFTSDNGFHLGQHRLPAGKQTAYETDIHLPLLVRGPGVAAGVREAAIAGNVDLAPTFAAIAGATLTDDPDGRSLLPLMARRDAGQVLDGWRRAYLLEHWIERSDEPVPGDGQVEPPDSEPPTSPPASAGKGTRRSAAALTEIPEFSGVRTGRYTYVEYSTGERELYDLDRDPDELDNIAGSAAPDLLSALHGRLDALHACRGEGCRQADASAPG